MRYKRNRHPLGDSRTDSGRLNNYLNDVRSALTHAGKAFANGKKDVAREYLGHARRYEQAIRDLDAQAGIEVTRAIKRAAKVMENHEAHRTGSVVTRTRRVRRDPRVGT